MKKYIFLFCILLIGNSLTAQNACPECDKFRIVGVYDFGPPPGGNFIILLLTVSEDLSSSFDPHYSSLFFVSNVGDTITIPLAHSYSLPQTASDTIPYMMELTTEMSNQDFPIDFDGKLHITTPTGGPCHQIAWCTINYTRSILSSTKLHSSANVSTIYPNPTRDIFRIECDDRIDYLSIFDRSGILLQSLYNVQSGDIIDLNHVDAGLLMVQIKYTNNTVQSHLVLKL